MARNLPCLPVSPERRPWPGAHPCIMAWCPCLAWVGYTQSRYPSNLQGCPVPRTAHLLGQGGQESHVFKGTFSELGSSPRSLGRAYLITALQCLGVARLSGPTQDWVSTGRPNLGSLYTSPQPLTTNSQMLRAGEGWVDPESRPQPDTSLLPSFAPMSDPPANS